MNSIRMFPTLAILAALLTLGSCGGDNAALETSQRTAPRMKALGISPTATAHISAITKISEVRISRTVYDYIFAVTITNGSIAQTDIVAELVSTGSGATIIDGVSRVARLARNESVVSGDRITIRQNRTIPFDASLLEWRISGALNPDSAIATIDSTGGTIQTPSGRLRLDIRFGALSSPQTVEISPADSDDTDEYPITGTAFHIIPEGLTFNKPVLITLKYDPAALPQGVNASDLLIGYKAGETSGMIQTVLDEPNHSLIGQISHFSRWYARGKTTTPAYVRGGLSIQSAKWETTDPNLIDGCWRVGENENQRQYFTDVEKLARALFKSQIPLTKPFTEHTGIGCITNPYLKNWYSIETPIPNENHAGIDFRTAGGDTAYAVLDGTVIRGGSTGTASVPPGLNLNSSPQVSTLIIESVVGGQRYWIFYVHCQSHQGLAPGMSVSAGQAVCTTGAVGTKAAHLHLELKRRGADPAGVLGVVSPIRSSCTSTIPGPSNSAISPGCSLAEVQQRTVDPTLLAIDAVAPPPPAVFEDTFDGATFDVAKWVVTQTSGVQTVLSQSGGFLNVFVPGGSCGSCGIGDGVRLTPKMPPLQGDFEVVLSGAEIERISRDASRTLSSLGMYVAGPGTTQIGVYIVGDALNNSGTPGHNVIMYYQSPGSTGYLPMWPGRALTIGSYYDLQLRIRRVSGVGYVAHKLSTDSDWIDHVVPAAFPAHLLTTPTIAIGSGDGRGTRVNSSFRSKLDFFRVLN